MPHLLVFHTNFLLRSVSSSRQHITNTNTDGETSHCQLPIRLHGISASGRLIGGSAGLLPPKPPHDNFQSPAHHGALAPPHFSLIHAHHRMDRSLPSPRANSDRSNLPAEQADPARVSLMAWLPGHGRGSASQTKRPPRAPTYCGRIKRPLGISHLYQGHATIALSIVRHELSRRASHWYPYQTKPPTRS